MAQLEDLEGLRETLLKRMAGTHSDHAFAELGRLFAETIKRIAELAPPESAPVEQKVSVVSEFEKKLAERQPGPARTRRRAN